MVTATRFYKLYLIAVLLLLAACGSTPNKSAAPARESVAEMAFQRGQQFWVTWEEDNNTSNLQVAHSLFKKAWEQTPTNPTYQHAYYLSSVYLGFYAENISERDLLPVYESLTPSVKAEVPPPARLAYAIGNFKNQTPETLIPVAKRAIKQNPEDAMSWKQLSEQYYRQQLYLLAAASAQKAYVMDATTSEYAWQLGSSLAKVADNIRCEQKNELLRSAFYTARAAALQKDNAWWYAESAQRYVELGLLPLAWHQLQMSLVLEPNAAYLTTFIHASILEGKEFQTAEFIAEAEQIHHTQESFKALAMAAASLGEWKNARDFMQLAKEQGDLDTYDLIIYHWLGQLAQTGSSAASGLRLATKLGEEEKAIRDFVLAEDEDTVTLARKLPASNTCYKQKIDFYTAMKSWQLGNRKQALENLQNAAKNPHYFAKEKVWASAFLQGMKRYN